ncbi:MAG TPA: extracellular solute-binding protein [Clostridiales bacterium]|nr:extracellular solute-binding protein [Clostridiales bacterium]
MKKYKKSLSFLLGLVIIIGLLAGCSTVNKSKESDKSTGSTTSDIKEPVVNQKISPEKITVSFFTTEDAVPMNENWLVFKAIEEKTNINMKLMTVSYANYEEKMNSLIASGDLPDLMTLRGNGEAAKKYGPDGAFVNLSANMDKMPNFKKYMDKFDSSANSYKLSKASDGNIYSAPRINDFVWITETYSVRADILKKHSLKTPDTFDEIYNMLVELKKLYPDSTPVVNRWGTNTFLGSVARFMHTGIGMQFDHAKNEYRYYPYDEDFKEALLFVQKLYKNGLLDPEFASTSMDVFTEKQTTGKAFFMYLYFVENDQNTMLGKEISKNPEFSIEPILPPMYKGSRGKGNVVSSVDLGFSKAISSKSKYVEPLIKFIDWLYSEDGIETVLFGLEGETFKRDSQGRPVLLDTVKTTTNPTGQNDIESYYGLYKQEIYSVQSEYSVDVIFRGPLYSKAQKMMVENGCYGKVSPVISLTAQDKEEVGNINTQVNTLRDETIIKIITGEYSIDKVDDFLKKAKELKIDRVIEIYNNQYKKEYGK